MKSRSYALPLLAAAALALSPARAEAKAVEDVLITSDPQDIVLTVLADAALHEPTVRTYSGSIRIRFYDAKDTPLLRLVGDGGAVRSVDVSEGSDKSAAVVVVLGDRTRLAPSDVRVEREGAKTVFRIARGLLPTLHEGSPMPSVPPVAAKPVRKPVAAPVVAAPVAAAPVAPPAAPSAPAVASAVQPTPAPVVALGVKRAPTKAQPKPGLKLASDQSSSPIPLLISITALLALAYGALRLFMKKNSINTDIPIIDIVAQKRIGPRHQLVIVRAFDRDYLLSIQGGQTTVVARGSRSKQIAAEQLQSPVASKLRARGRTRDGERDLDDDEVTFGGELFKTALEQRERTREQTAGVRLEAARAEARAELARLDGSRQDFALADFSRQEALRNELDNPPSSRDELIVPDVRSPSSQSGVVESTPDAMSESVSGLLRLRKASGR
jgi:flagellar biogenesis protein FliO